jgi:hypothetical protein
MAVGGTQPTLRKYLGALKDTTTVSLAKVNSDYKDLDIAIVKATNHVERPSKEKYIREIFLSISAARPRADVAYCIHALARRLSKTRNWAVALKTLIVIHRALREVDPTFREELINYGRSRSHMLNMAYFKDDSSAEAWDYSAWVRIYALYLEERLECFRVLKYDVETDPPVCNLMLLLHYSCFLHLQDLLKSQFTSLHSVLIHITMCSCKMSLHIVLLSGTIYACNWREENAQYCLVSFHCRGMRHINCICPKVNLHCSYHVDFVLPHSNSISILGVRNGACN